MPAKTKARATALSAPTDGARPFVEFEVPYVVQFTLEGTVAILFHAWNVEAVEEKRTARKGSTGKTTDAVDTYVYRNEKSEVCIPGSYVHGAMKNAAKFRQDPRSPRKSAFDLYGAAVAPLTELASLGKKDWDYLDRRRAVVQRNGITRVRPAFLAGWRATFEFTVTLPEYVRPLDFHDVLTLAGRTIGLADHRPTYGRFVVVRFDTKEA